MEQSQPRLPTVMDPRLSVRCSVSNYRLSLVEPSVDNLIILTVELAAQRRKILPTDKSENITGKVPSKGNWDIGGKFVVQQVH